MRAMIRGGDYVMTTHADEEADADELSVFDVENAVLSGAILHRQKDTETDEWKYLIRCESIADRQVTVVVKVGASGKILYIITAYAE
jgi:hypothetical protein